MLLLPSRRKMSVLLKQFNEPKKNSRGKVFAFPREFAFYDAV